MEICRFGIGYRRPDGPPGTRGVQGLAIHSDARGAVSELALERSGSISPHSNPNLTYFLVIEGGGFVRVGDETARVSAGDAVIWPPDVVHAAWTEVTPMRAIVVEFTGMTAVPLRLPAQVEVLADEPADPGTDDPSPAREPITRDGEPW